MILETTFHEFCNDQQDKFTGNEGIISGLSFLPFSYLPLHNDLRPTIYLGLEKNWIHHNAWSYPAGLSLQNLRAAHLAAVWSHKGIQRHILRFKWRNIGSCAAKQAADTSRHQTLPHI